MKFTESKISGCKIIQSNIFKDTRGSFNKNFSKNIFTQNDIKENFDECYFSRSKKGVIRGMHFQTKPHEISKLIFCSEGEIIDVFLDIRPSSKTYGQFDTVMMTSENGINIYLPKGIAHGFQVISENATVHYLQSGIYEKKSDSGILWNSFGMEWPLNNPILSDRDLSFQMFKDYK